MLGYPQEETQNFHRKPHFLQGLSASQNETDGDHESNLANCSPPSFRQKKSPLASSPINTAIKINEVQWRTYLLLLLPTSTVDKEVTGMELHTLHFRIFSIHTRNLKAYPPSLFLSANFFPFKHFEPINQSAFLWHSTPAEIFIRA